MGGVFFFDKLQSKLWEELTWLRSCWNMSWCVGGDFNVERFPLECLGIKYFTFIIH